MGFVPSHDDVMKEIASSTVFVSASEIEGFGITVIEAAAVDVPFVITDMPVFRETTRNGIGGLLFRKGDATDLAEQIDRTLTGGAVSRRRDDVARATRVVCMGHARRSDGGRVRRRDRGAAGATGPALIQLAGTIPTKSAFALRYGEWYFVPFTSLNSTSRHSLSRLTRRR